MQLTREGQQRRQVIALMIVMTPLEEYSSAVQRLIDTFKAIHSSSLMDISIEIQNKDVIGWGGEQGEKEKSLLQ